MVNRFWQYLSHQLLPHYCYLCTAPSRRPLPLCEGCEQDLPRLSNCCSRCAFPLAQSNETCGQCLQQPPSFTKAVAGWHYSYPVNHLIQQFKYHRQSHYGTLLARLLAHNIRRHYSHTELPDYIAATPMHWRRRLQRGENHAHWLASVLSRELQRPLLKGLQRNRHTATQQGLNKNKRYSNMKRAFRLDPRCNVSGLRLAVVDDVMTTGATADAISHCLLTAGAQEVHIWTLARTPLD